MSQEMSDRSFRFALKIIALARSLPHSVDGAMIARQLLRAGTSIGANIEEAEAAHSRDDFAYKTGVALREARETHYWLRLAKESGILDQDGLGDLIGEAEQLKKILGAIVSKARGTSKKKRIE